MKAFFYLLVFLQVTLINNYMYNVTCPNGLLCEVKVTLETKCERYLDYCFPCSLQNCPQETEYDVNCPSATCQKIPHPPKEHGMAGKVIGWSFGAIILLLSIIYGLKKIKVKLRRREYSDIPMSIINSNVDPELQDELRRHPSIVRFSTLRRNDEFQFETSEL